MEIRVLREDESTAYDEFLRDHPAALVFHSTAYREFLKSLLGCREHYLVATDHRGIQAVMPLMYLDGEQGKVYNSLPYVGSNGGILARSPQARREVETEFRNLLAQPGVVAATIVGNPLDGNAEEPSGYRFTDERICQFTELPTSEDVRASLLATVEASARRNVKKALSRDIRVDADSGALPRVWALYGEHMREIGAPAPHPRFLAETQRWFRPGTHYDCFVARKAGEVIAGILVFYFNATVQYFASGIDPRFRSDQPLSLAILEAMAALARRGFRTWNWGGTGLGMTGLYRFKRKWATRETTYRYFTFLEDPQILGWEADRILAAYPHFYVVPFSSLRSPSTRGD